MSIPRVAPVHIQTYLFDKKESKGDLLAVEEPMEIQLVHGAGSNRKKQSLSITMRTPGHDLELTLGFLVSEGIISTRDQVKEIRHCQQVEYPEAEGNVVRVELDESLTLEEDRLTRNFVASASCGVCGKASMEGIEQMGCSILADGPVWASSLIHQMPAKLKEFQTIFSHTGGLHAAALFDREGKLLYVREDIGRHNALDKLIGVALEAGILPLSEYGIFLSGRIGFELVQKALMAGSPVLAAVGAPSSLAVRLAGQYGMSLLGFVRDQRFNVYCGEERILL